MPSTRSAFSKLADLSGRRAVVAGGAGHIGRVVAEALRAQGAEVAALDVVKAPGVEACDLSDAQASREALRQAVKKLGGLDILFHCAAFVGTTKMKGWAEAFEKQSAEAFDAALRVNLTSAFVLGQEAAGPLAKSGRGSIVLFSSIYGLGGPDMSLYEGTSMANPAGYGASKGGVIQLTRHLATTLAPRVRVNCISPGGVLRGQPESFQKRYVQRTPLRRMAREDDLLGAAVYLASDLSAYVTGHNLVVDGGWTAW